MKRNRIALIPLAIAALLGLSACPRQADLPAAQLSLDASSCTLAVGTEFKLTALLDGVAATASELTWTSGDPSVATVSAEGLVKAGVVGSATITAKTADGRATADCSVSVNTFFAGSCYDGTKGNACYWQDGVLHSLSGDIAGSSCALSPVVFNGGRRYIAGAYIDELTVVPCYWEGDTRHDLGGSLPNSATTGLAVANGIVYTAGYYWDTTLNHHVPCYWENGTFHALGDDQGQSFSSFAYTSAIAASGGTVYLAGIYDATGRTEYAACYWEGSSFHALESGASGQARTTAIAVSGGTVYTAGNYRDGSIWLPCYWEGTSMRSLENGLSENACAYAITVSGETVYTAGSYWDGSNNIPCYWEGEVLHSLKGSLASDAYCFAIAVSGGRVYAAGQYWDGTKYAACYWEGNDFHALDDGGAQESAVANYMYLY